MNTDLLGHRLHRLARINVLNELGLGLLILESFATLRYAQDDVWGWGLGFVGWDPSLGAQDDVWGWGLVFVWGIRKPPPSPPPEGDNAS